MAAPFDDENSEESLNDFALPASLAKITEQVNKIYLFHSKDDHVVPFEQAGKYKNAIPNSEIIVFADRQHFNQEHFPELVELLKKNNYFFNQLDVEEQVNFNYLQFKV